MSDIFKRLEDKVQIELMIKLAKSEPVKTIKEHTEDTLQCAKILHDLNYIADNHVYELVQLACLFHDIGKLNNQFQKRVSSKNIPFDQTEIAHNILSACGITKSSFKNEIDYYYVLHAVLNHHHYHQNVYSYMDKIKVLPKELLMLGFSIPKRRDIKQVSVIIEDELAILTKGFLHKCDYSASANRVVEYENDFLDQSLDNLITKWRTHNKNASWNSLQEFTKSNKDKNLIAVAQTGMGKTEAGLLWIGNQKGFFVLPLRTAINAIYSRIKRDILSQEDIKRINEKVAILHGGSLEYYLEDFKENDDFNILNYHEMSKMWSIPVNITTLDQVFNFVYKYHNYELKLATLSYSKIVIDEIQMYGPDLLAYLICGIEMIVALGGKVAILTATLPPFVKAELCKNIEFIENKKPFVSDKVRHHVAVFDDELQAKPIYDKFIENKQEKKSNKVLVVCNTVKKAQALYEALSENIDKKYLHLLHSKFIRKDRSIREHEVLKVGQTYNEIGEIDKQCSIWISTSIVEASLDIDFDYLFTELQELSSLFQRLGRCNRKGVKSIEEINCFVYTKINQNLLVAGNRGFIDPDLYKLSKQALNNFKGLLSEQEKINLIDKTLTSENMKNSKYMLEYRNIYSFIKEVRPYEFRVNSIDMRNIESQEIIPYPVYEQNKQEIEQLFQHLKETLIKLRTPAKSEVVRLKEDCIRIKEAIKQFSVSVRPKEVKYNYMFKLELSRYESLWVVDCAYDELGFQRKKNHKK